MSVGLQIHCDIKKLKTFLGVELLDSVSSFFKLYPYFASKETKQKVFASKVKRPYSLTDFFLCAYTFIFEK